MQQLQYDISDLFRYIDSLGDLCMMTFNQQANMYVPHDKKWVKDKVSTNRCCQPMLPVKGLCTHEKAGWLLIIPGASMPILADVQPRLHRHLDPRTLLRPNEQVHTRAAMKHKDRFTLGPIYGSMSTQTQQKLYSNWIRATGILLVLKCTSTCTTLDLNIANSF